MNELLIFLLGSLSGCSFTFFFFITYHSRKVQEMHDEFLSVREEIRRNAYARGYEVAKTGGIKAA